MYRQCNQDVPTNSVSSRCFRVYISIAYSCHGNYGPPEACGDVMKLISSSELSVEYQSGEYHHSNQHKYHE